MPRGRLADAHHSRVSSSPQWGVELGWEAEVPAGTSYSGGPLPGLCWGQREGPGHWARRAYPGRWPWSPEGPSWALCSGRGQSPHRPQARVHGLNRAPPGASCAAPSSQAGEPRGPRPALCVKAETWPLGGGGAMQGTELACRLGMASTISMGLAKTSLLEIIFPLPC